MQKRGTILGTGLISAAVCGFSLAFLLWGGGSYATAENVSADGVVSAFAENSEAAEIKEGSRFDDSLWGDLARALEKAVSRFLE